MRFILAIVTCCVIVLALLLVRSALQDAPGRTSASVAGANPGVVATAANITATVEPTPTPYSKKVSHQAAVEYGRMQAKAYGEENPVLVEAVETTLNEANARLNPDGNPADGPVRPVVPGDSPVWLVRMRGNFMPAHQAPPPPGADPTKVAANRGPREGWMFIVVDAQTGKSIESGFRVKRNSSTP